MTIQKKTRNTLLAVEMDRGDALELTLQDGETRVITLVSTDAKVIRTTLKNLGVEEPRARTDYEFTCVLDIDGTEHTLWREVSTQRSFYEPWEIDGVQIWFDAVEDIFAFLNEDHGKCRPRKHARFAFHDAGSPVCPSLLHPWCPLPPGGLNINDCYNGEDCWLGAYFGASAHGGLDINHPAGTPIFAPFDLDDHYLFETVYNGANNNRWRGWKVWHDGSEWIIQCHHVIKLETEAHEPVVAGTQVCRGAGVAVGSHEHSHFVFGVKDNTNAEVILLDPWILFRQMYIDLHGRR